MLNEERITTVRKKQEMTEEAFRKKGFDVLLADIKVPVSLEDNGKKQFNKLVAAIKRKVSRYLNGLSDAEKWAFLADLPPGFQRLQAEPFVKDPEQAAWHDYVGNLLTAAADKPSAGESADGSMIRLEVIKGDDDPLQAAALLNRGLKKKYHGKSWQMKRGNFGAVLLYDLSELVAETLAINAVEKFARENKELVQYLTADFMNVIVTENATPLPTDPVFSADLTNVMERYGLLKDVAVPVEKANAFKSVFYLETGEAGYIKDVDHFLMLYVIVPEFLRQMKFTQVRADQEADDARTFAKAFQTKKNIYVKTKEKMEDNAFLERYGYVEVDNDTDLGLFAKLEADFRAFIDVVPVPYARDHSFRIKKLGNYKAAGIYFPSYRATIIDLDHPDSYAHELAHQLDYTLDASGKMLSEQLSFRPIADAYMRLCDKAVDALPKNDEVRAKWRGKTKYNRSYFAQPTEIFARSFELYLKQKGLVTSFLKETYAGPQYPTDSQFLEQVDAYFDALLLTVRNEQKAASEGISA